MPALTASSKPEVQQRNGLAQNSSGSLVSATCFLLIDEKFSALTHCFFSFIHSVELSCLSHLEGQLSESHRSLYGTWLLAHKLRPRPCHKRCAFSWTNRGLLSWHFWSGWWLHRSYLFFLRDRLWLSQYSSWLLQVWRRRWICRGSEILFQWICKLRRICWVGSRIRIYLCCVVYGCCIWVGLECREDHCTFFLILCNNSREEKYL